MTPGPDATQASPTGRIRPARAVLAAALKVAPQLRPRIEKLVWRAVYEAASIGRRNGQAPLNYGYADPNADAADGGEDGFGRALYAKVAGAIELSGLDVLEVGCGRGGGAAYVFETLGPKSMVGLDLAASAVKRAQSHYGRPGLRYVSGDAESLPFANASFDAVLNVESSHCYPDPLAFFREAHRVLRPGGHLLMADLRRTELPPGESDKDVAGLRREIELAGFTTIVEEDITANVVRALALDTPRRVARVERTIPRIARPHILALMAVEGTQMYDDFDSRRLTYLRFVLQKA